ncbi:restriction endonuclease subunit S [Azospirillum doebereinerae]|nr:restriction endonuclease subunit S [Azospirillum doebereinerae]
MNTSSYPAYRSYKESCVGWISQIPAHWEIKNPKWLFSQRRERARKGELQLAATQKYGVIPQSDFMDFEGRRITQVFLDFDILKHVDAGDFVMSMRSFQGGLEYSEYTGCVSSAYVALNPGPRVYAPFFKYLLKSSRYIEALQATSNLVRDGQALRFENFTMVPLPVVPIEEQCAIAAFLDGKCGKIDEAVRIKEEQITLLRERRQILIQQAVTHGLNPSAPMKDSGIDWIGQIPAHWKVQRSKYVFTQRKELARKDDIQLSATQSYGVIPQDEFEELVGRRVVKIQTNLEKRKHVELDDFVISMRSFQGGLERAFATGCIRSSYVILQPLEPVNPDFFGYLFKSPRYIKALQATGSFIRDGQDLNFDNFSKVDLFLPPLDEQAAIAAHIKAGCEKIDNGIAIKEEQIAALKEYKTSLINAAVTGKIKVA